MSANRKSNWSQLLLPFAILGCLFVIFVPLPAQVLDLLLAANITVAVIVLLTTLQVSRPLEMSLFPALLLGTTLARLALNISTTRLILTDGAVVGDMAAGGVIRSFGHFVGGNNIAIGLVIFAIIIVIQFVVITKGASRISEVAARFSLDGLPGKQMSIDADLNAGVIDGEEARLRRLELGQQADFYGAMDGASKFVRGDAIAGVLITLINIAGGLIVGLTSGMSLTGAAEVFTMLTIGDGLVSQIPALLIAMAAGVLVARSTTPVDLPRESVRQVFSRPQVMYITACFLCVLIFTGLPAIPLLILAAVCVAIAVLPASESAQESPATPSTQPPSRPQEVTIDKLLSSDVVEMELGAGLIRLADPRAGGNLLAAITQVRKELAADLGVILPKVRVRDNLQLEGHSYRILLQGNPINSGSVRPDCLLAIDNGNVTAPVPQESLRGIFDDQITSGTAYWIAPESHESISQAGYLIVTSTDVLADQLKNSSVDFAAELLTRDATRQLIDETRKNSPAVVDELIPDLLSLAGVQRVLKALLREGVSIRPLGLILETLGDSATDSAGHHDLIEKVRLRLSPHILSQLTTPDEPLAVFTISEELEHRIACSWERDQDQIKLDLPAHTVEGLAVAIEHAARNMKAAGQRPVALVDQTIRPVIVQLASCASRDLLVIGRLEAGDTELQLIGEVTVEDVRNLQTAAA
ncbi:MAG: flagellar biosynthesis protein FlhA [Planctomycetota bacterium]